MSATMNYKEVSRPSDAETKIAAQKKAKMEAELAVLTAQVEMQATKVVKSMGERAAEDVSLDDVVDGKHTAAQQMLSKHINDDHAIDVSATVEEGVLEEQADDLAMGEEGGAVDVAERMASLQLKRLNRHIQEIERYKKRLAHRLAEASKEEAKAQAALKDPKLKREAQLEAQKKIAQVQAERASSKLTEERLKEDLAACLEDMTMVEQSFKAKDENIGDTLLSIMPVRMGRIGDQISYMDEEITRLAEEASKKREVLEYAEMTVDEEEDFLASIAVLDTSRNSLIKEQKVLADTKLQLQDEFVEISAALNAGATEEELQARIAGADSQSKQLSTELGESREREAELRKQLEEISQNSALDKHVAEVSAEEVPPLSSQRYFGHYLYKFGHPDTVIQLRVKLLEENSLIQ